ncbi:hypothetical protein [Fortiea contorta]|uniref:hypothetical protein n=1 Tax=Fortiea contorta TaxID=1892405 RepID=UPI00034D27F5|nr:hypothetical protein [Fortiea contorta]
MTIKGLFPLILTILLSNSTGLVAANPPKNLVSPTKPKAASTHKPVTQPLQPKWKLFTAPDGRFTILMPGVPIRNTQAQKTHMGVINLQLFVAQPAKQEVAYLVVYNDFPYSYGQMANPQDILNQARDLALKTTKSNLISQGNIRSSNGHPGKEIEYINSAGKITKARMYFAQGRLYQVMAVSSKKQHKTLAKTIAGYLNSFQVVLKTGNI